MTLQQDYQDYTLEAESIGSSGRWDKLDKRVVAICNDPRDYKLWRAQVLLALSVAVLKEYKKLKRAYTEHDGYLQSIAFHARNILELNVWIAYVSLSESNARTFYLESGVDGMEILKTGEEFGIKHNQTQEWLANFADAKARVRSSVDLESDESLDGRSFSNLKKVAQEAGLGELYPVSNKMLSKHTHPTAWIVMMHQNENMIRDLKDTLFNKGCWLFVGAIQGLEKHVGEVLLQNA